MKSNSAVPTLSAAAAPVMVGDTADAAQGQGGPWLLLARVSTASRRELRAHVDTALQPHLWRAEVKAIYNASKAPYVLDKGKAGDDARRALGWSTVYAPGTRRELGVLACEGDVQVLFINASASQRDLGEDQNSLILSLETLILAEAFRGSDPHAPADQRPQILAPYADRLIRDHELGWKLFNAAVKAHAVFRIAGKDPLDTTLGSEAQNKWMFYAWESASGKDTTVSRLTNGALNRYRAGLYGGSESGLPRGYRWEHEPMPDGTWRRSCDTDAKTVLDHYPEPDPESWWEVEAIMRIAADSKVQTWRELARRLGLAGLGARGADERGVPLHLLSDPVSAAKQLLKPRNLDTYATGRYRYEQVGPGHGVWSLPGGHRFEPRWPGDEQGSIVYTLDLGLPAWPSGFTSADVERVKAKWWPAGTPKKSPPGARGTARPRRALAGLVAWAEEDYRYEVFAHSGRYELRRQDLAGARRRKDGELADMRHDTSELVASWLEAELSRHVADLLDRTVETFLTTHPDAKLAVSVPTVRSSVPAAEDPGHRREREITGLLAAAAKAERQATGASTLANDLYADGDRAGGRAKHEESVKHQAQAEELRARADDLRTRPLESATATPRAVQALDVATPAAVVVALRGPYGSGPQPAELNAALERYLGAGAALRIERVSGSSAAMRLVAEVRLPLSDGTVAEVPAELTVPAKVADASAEGRVHELAEKYMWHGHAFDELAILGRRATADVLRRQIREYLGDPARRLHPNQVASTAQGARIADAGLRTAILGAPLETRRVIWANQTSKAVPAGLPRGFAEHVRNRYLSDPVSGTAPEPWTGEWARLQPTRYRALAVLDSHPSLRHTGMRTDHLAACLGVSVREINDISRVWAHQHRQDPPTLARLGAWADEAAPDVLAEEKLVAPIRCRHRRRGGGQCRGLVTAVLFCPEVLSTGQGVLCIECHRPPGLAQAFPASYITEAMARLRAHAGDWVPCGYAGCTVDFGPGPGLMWRWNSATAVAVWHGPDCQAGRAPTPPAPRVRHCADPACEVDEGFGAGMIADAGRATRRWHSPQCRAAAAAGKDDGGRASEPRACGYADCVVDEGHGAGWLRPESRPSRRWHDWRCQRAAERAKSGKAPAGTVQWADCGDTTCTVDEGGGPGKVRHVVGATGRPRRYHGQACARRARRT